MSTSYSTGRKFHSTPVRRYKRTRNIVVAVFIVLASIGAMAGHAYATGYFVPKQVEKPVETPVEAPKPLSMRDQVLKMVEDAGLDKYQAYTIVHCESHWNANGINIRNTNGTYDAGLWMINSIQKDISNADKFDPIKATKWAIAKRQHDGNWKAWTCSHNL